MGSIWQGSRQSGVASDESPVAAYWMGCRVNLRPVSPDDYVFIHFLETHPEVITRWRHQGRTPSPEELARTMWEGQLVTLLAVSSRSGERAGIVNAYNPDPANGYCYMGVLGMPSVWRTGLMFDASVLLIAYLFATWPFRKLYIETVEYNRGQLSSLARLGWELEARFHEQVYLGGRYWDRLVYTLDRAAWAANGQGALRGVLGMRTAVETDAKLERSAEFLVRTALASVTDLDSSEIRSSDGLEDLGLDSLAFFELFVQLSEYGIALPDEYVASAMLAVNDVVAYVDSQLADGRSA